MLKLSYAVFPAVVNQPFGANPDYYARFHDAAGNPEKGHMGIDFMASHATPLYAPCDGSASYGTDEHGGDGIYIHTTDGLGNWYNVILWHLCSKDDPQFKPLIPTDGSSVPVKRGDHIGYTDNTGAPFESSGDHLHFGLIPVNETNTITLFPNNGYNGCIDPHPYFDGTYAVNAVDPVAAIVQTTADITAHIATLPKNQQAPLLEAVKKVVENLLAYLKARG